MDKLVDRLHDDHAWHDSNVCQNPFFGSDDDPRKRRRPKQKINKIKIQIQT